MSDGAAPTLGSLWRLYLKIFDQVLHSNATGQEFRSLGLHQRERALAGTIDSHDSPEINHEFALWVGPARFLPMGTKVRNPGFSEQSLENYPLF